MSFLGRGDRHDLGAIRAEGEHLEYSLPGNVVDAMGKKDAMAFCASDAMGYARMLQSSVEELQEKIMRSRTERSRTTAVNQLKSLEDAIFLMESESSQLRLQGIKGPIPVCIYRLSGKGAGKGEWRSRANVRHERFHAELRRLETQMGVRVYGFDNAMDLLLHRDLSSVRTNAKFIARAANWSSKNEAVIEEMLARVAEQSDVCTSSTSDCRELAASHSALISEVNSKLGKKIPTNTFEVFTAEVLNRYGSAIGFVKTAASSYPEYLVR